MYDKKIVYDAHTRDFAMYLNEVPIGFRQTHQEAETVLNDMVYVLMSKQHIPVEPDPVVVDDDDEYHPYENDAWYLHYDEYQQYPYDYSG